MVCQKDLFNHLISICSIKESFINLSENIDIIELCYMLGEYTNHILIKSSFLDSNRKYRCTF